LIYGVSVSTSMVCLVWICVPLSKFPPFWFF
jgi:hypothetical protein